jgi:hypothetical protein
MFASTNGNPATYQVVPTLEFQFISGEQFCSDASGSTDAQLQWCPGHGYAFDCCPCSSGLVDDKTVLPGGTKEILKMLLEFSTPRNGTPHYRQLFAYLRNGEILSQKGLSMFTVEQYRAKAIEYSNLVRIANNPNELSEFQKLERSYAELADNAQWAIDNYDKTLHGARR